MTVDHSRAERARRGSRRQRDVEALAAEERVAFAPPGDVRQSAQAVAAFVAVRERLAGALCPATFELWIEPLQVLGERDGAIALAGPERVGSWNRRRYGLAIGELVREHSGFRGVFIYDLPEPEAEAVTCQ